MRNRVIRALAAPCALGLALAMAGCSGGSGGSDAEPVTAETLVGDWTLASGSGPDGDIEPLESAITASFEDGENISTTVGCNNIFGAVALGADGELELGPLAATMMMCDEPLMNLEAAYSAALEAVDHGVLEGKTLVLTGENVNLTYESAG